MKKHMILVPFSISFVFFAAIMDDDAAIMDFQH